MNTIDLKLKNLKDKLRAQAILNSVILETNIKLQSDDLKYFLKFS